MALSSGSLDTSTEPLPSSETETEPLLVGLFPERTKEVSGKKKKMVRASTPVKIAPIYSVRVDKREFNPEMPSPT